MAVLFVCSLTSTGCSKSEAPAPAASPRPLATPTVVVTSAALTPAPATSANPAAVQDLNDFSDTADWEWNLADEADTTDFEIDADATSYYMPVGNVVTFKAKALNGTPPFTYSWDFRDGTPPLTGEMVKHVFPRLGFYDVLATGTDASGAKYIVTLGIGVAHPVEYAIRARMAPEDIEKIKAHYPDYVYAPPSPAEAAKR